MIKQGKDKLEGIKELRSEYKVPQNELVKMWLEIKGSIEIINPHTPKKTIKKAEKVEEIPYTVTEKEIEKSMQETGFEIIDKKENENIDIKNIVENLERENAKHKAPSTLKIISQTTVIQGEYGTYYKTELGVKTENIEVKDIKDLENYKSAVNNDYNKDKEDLNQQI